MTCLPTDLHLKQAVIAEAAQAMSRGTDSLLRRLSLHLAVVQAREGHRQDRTVPEQREVLEILQL